MTLIKTEAFTRADRIDAELDWPAGLAIGRLAKLWSEAQKDKGSTVVRRRLILQWAQVEPQYADQFLELCCSTADDLYIHFLELEAPGWYRIVGNQKQLQNLVSYRERGRAGGNAKQRNRGRAALPPASSASSPASSSASSSASSPALPVSVSVSVSVSEDESDTKGGADSTAGAECGAAESPAGGAAGAGSGGTPPPPEDTDTDLVQARHLKEAILRHNPAATGPRKASMRTWAATFAALRAEGVAAGTIDFVIQALYNENSEWYIHDPFERNQITSAPDFRRRWDKITAQINNPKINNSGFSPRDSQGRVLG